MKIMICAKCGSTDVTRDGLLKWDPEGGVWEACAELDCTNCNCCGDEQDLAEAARPLKIVGHGDLDDDSEVAGGSHGNLFVELDDGTWMGFDERPKDGSWDNE